STLSESFVGILPAGTYYANIASYGGHTQALTFGGTTMNTTYYYDTGAYFLTGATTANVHVWSSTATGPWSTASNWSCGVPGAADVAMFNSASYLNGPSLTSTASVGGLWSTGTAAVTLSGSSLTLYGLAISGNTATGIELDSGAGAMTINAPLVLQND